MNYKDMLPLHVAARQLRSRLIGALDSPPKTMRRFSCRSRVIVAVACGIDRLGSWRCTRSKRTMS
jgi:hypothetical protein